MAIESHVPSVGVGDGTSGRNLERNGTNVPLISTSQTFALSARAPINTWPAEGYVARLILSRALFQVVSVAFAVEESG